MKAFNKIFICVIFLLLIIAIIANAVLLRDRQQQGRPYLVEISRLQKQIEDAGFDNTDVSSCKYVTGVYEYNDDFYTSKNDYTIREINGILYRFDYITPQNDNKDSIITVNVIIAVIFAVTLGIMIYIKVKILSPFEKLSNVPYELSRGNLSVGVKETKNRFFGRFVWGVDMLRENIEDQKRRELDLQKERKMLLLSLSHDVKTPLSAIKLYSQALSRGLYSDAEKQREISVAISEKADEIQGYISQIITASKEDFLSFEVKNGEFYLSELVERTKLFYKEKLALIKTELIIDDYADCLLKGDLDRGCEVLQNTVENAIKYGDGKYISISFSQEDGCILITVKNGGCTLDDKDTPHVFDSFWRGENAKNEQGSGLGLYICQCLMRKMNGDIFANIENGEFAVCAVFAKA